MPLEVIHYPHPTLRYVSKPIQRVDRQLRSWVAEMIDLMYEHEGVGLAANQVNLPYRLFVMNPTGDSQQPEAEQVLINPVLSRGKGRQEGQEGCLSLPDVHADVVRHAQIHVEAYNLAGEQIVCTLEGFAARVVQHENDHLDGTMFIERLPPTVLAELRPLVEEFETDYQSRLATGEADPEGIVQARLAELVAARC